MLKQLFSLMLLLQIAMFAYGQTEPTPEYQDTLKKMFVVSGSEGAYQAAIDQMFILFKQQYSNVDAAIWDGLKQEFSKKSIEDLKEMLAPVYAKYLTMDDLKALIRFYETPVGVKFAKNNPMILQESMQVGQQWGMKIGQAFAEKMKEKGY